MWFLWAFLCCFVWSLYCFYNTWVPIWWRKKMQLKKKISSLVSRAPNYITTFKVKKYMLCWIWSSLMQSSPNGMVWKTKSIDHGLSDLPFLGVNSINVSPFYSWHEQEKLYRKRYIWSDLWTQRKTFNISPELPFFLIAPFAPMYSWNQNQKLIKSDEIFKQSLTNKARIEEERNCG